MDLAEVRAWLEAVDQFWEPSVLTADRIEFRGGGGSGAWNCRCGDRWFVVKCQNNGHEPPAPPLKIVTTELICGRLGELFDPPIGPRVGIVDVPAEIANAVVYPNTNRNPTAGKSFGSELIEGCVETKGTLATLPVDQAARVIVFQSWLRGEDPAVLIPASDQTCLSVDHGWYLTGSAWNWPVLADTAVTSVYQRTQIGDFNRLADETIFRPALDQLLALPETAIAATFGSIPAEWGLDLDQRSRLAHCILQRRNHVESAVGVFWQEVN